MAYSREIDLIELFVLIYKKKLLIIVLTAIFAIGSALFAINIPNKYQSVAILASAQTDSSGMGQGRLGGLVALAGINVDKGTERIQQAIEVIGNWPFFDLLSDKKYFDEFLPEIFAAKDWDKQTNKIIYDDDLYNENSHSWVVREDGSSSKPSSYKIYKKINSIIELNMDSSSSLLTLRVSHYSPEVAQKLSLMLIEELNTYFQQIDIASAKRNIKYLNEKISETSITEMQGVFYNLIESQTKALMLAEVGSEYLFKPIVPPMVSEEKFSPRRGFICAVGTFLGLIFSIFLALTISFLRTK